MIAAFDPSITHFGWVLLDETKDGKEAFLDSGTFKTDPSDGLLVQRLILQRERVRKFLVGNNIKFISMEAPYWGDFNTELLFALNQFIHEMFLNMDMFIFYVQPQTLKKFACPQLSKDKVKITKHHIVHQAKTELELHGKRFSEHVSDAYFAGKLGSIFYKWFFLKTLQDEDLPVDLQEMFYGKHTFVKGAKKGITEYNGIIYKENDQFFDYKKQTRKTTNIISEVANGN